MVAELGGQKASCILYASDRRSTRRVGAPAPVWSKPLPAIVITLAAAESAGGLRARFVDIQRSAVEFLAVQAGNGTVRIRRDAHLDKAETFRLTGIAVGNDIDALDSSVCLEHRSNRIFGRSEIEVPYKYILHVVFPSELTE